MHCKCLLNSWNFHPVVQIHMYSWLTIETGLNIMGWQSVWRICLPCLLFALIERMYLWLHALVRMSYQWEIPPGHLRSFLTLASGLSRSCLHSNLLFHLVNTFLVHSSTCVRFWFFLALQIQTCVSALFSKQQNAFVL